MKTWDEILADVAQEAMLIETRVTRCPTCKGKRYIGHILCVDCLGCGQITYQQRKQPMKKARLWKIGILLLIAAAVALIEAGVYR